MLRSIDFKTMPYLFAQMLGLRGEDNMSLDDVCWNISSVFIVITLGVIAILCVLTLLGVFVCIFDHDDKNDKSSKE